MIGVAIAASSGLAAQQALAQTTPTAIARMEAFGGSSRDDRPLGGNDNGSSFGILPSASFAAGPARLQLDGLAAEHLDTTIAAVAGQLTAPWGSDLTLGLYGSYVRHQFAGDLTVYRVGGQANYQGERTTLSVVAGYEDVEDAVVPVGVIPGFTVADTYGRQGAFGVADLTYYPSDNWALLTGYRYIGGRHAGALGAERLFTGETLNLSLFAEGRIGDDSYAAGWVGIRIRFGEGAGTLRDRDRAGGLPNRLKDELFGLSNTRRRSATAIPVVVPPPVVPPVVVPPGPTCGCGPCYPT